MKKLLYLILILFCIPTMVYAEETTDVTLKDLVLKKAEGYTEILSEAEIVDNQIVLNLKMYEVGDSAEYQFTIQNDTNQDFMADTQSLITQNSTIEYQLMGEDKSNIVEKKSTKKFTLTVTYKNEVEKTLFKAGKYKPSSNAIIQFRDPSLINPLTGSIFYSIILTIILITIGFIVIKKSKAKLLLFLLLLIPVSTLAFYEYDVVLDSNIIIGYVTPNPCTFDGEMVQGAEYVNGQYAYRYMQRMDYRESWANIEEDGWGVILIDKASTDPVTTKMCTSINDKPIVYMSYTFYGSKTTSIDTSSIDTSNVIWLTNMFNGCSNLTELDLSNFDTGNVTNIVGMLQGCTSLKEIDVSNFDSSKITEASLFFAGSTSVEYLNLSNMDFSRISSFGGGFASIGNNIKKIDLTNVKFPASMYCLFAGLQCDELILDNVDTSIVNDMFQLFAGSNKVKELNLSSFDTSHVPNMNSMFSGCSSLTTLDVSNFDTSSLVSMRGMFTSCSNLISLNMSGFDISRFSSNSFQIIAGCSNLKEINLSGCNLRSEVYQPSGFWGSVFNCSTIESIDLSNAILPTNLVSAFSGLTNLKIINLEGVDTSNVTNMDSIFKNCSSLEYLDLSSFDMSTVTNIDNMFNGCTSLTTGYARTQADADILNNSSNKPSGLTFTVKV